MFFFVSSQSSESADVKCLFDLVTITDMTIAVLLFVYVAKGRFLGKGGPWMLVLAFW